MTKAELNGLIERLIRIRDIYDFTRAERDDLADACNIIYHNIDALSEEGMRLEKEALNYSLGYQDGFLAAKEIFEQKEENNEKSD